jgi:hypothetical protein
MKDLHEVLQQKELDIRRVQSEIEALHSVIPLLADDADWLEQGVVRPSLKDRRRREAALV